MLKLSVAASRASRRSIGIVSPGSTSGKVFTAAASLLLVFAALAQAKQTERGEDVVQLPKRVRRIILHVPGGPSYEEPARRFVYYSPSETMSLWKPHFGTHWIVWTEGSIWPRHVKAGEARFYQPT